jgi:hypothetical protein
VSHPPAVRTGDASEQLEAGPGAFVAPDRHNRQRRLFGGLRLALLSGKEALHKINRSA